MAVDPVLARLAAVLEGALAGHISAHDLGAAIREVALLADAAYQLEPLPSAAEIKAKAEAVKQAAVEAKHERTISSMRAVVRRVFDAWQKAMNKPNSKLTPEREQAVMARLRAGYTEQEIVQAIHNVANSSFHRGENDRNQQYVDLLLICRNGAQLERYRDWDEMGPGAKGQDQDREAVEALQEGKLEDYERITGSHSRMDPALGRGANKRGRPRSVRERGKEPDGQLLRLASETGPTGKPPC